KLKLSLMPYLMEQAQKATKGIPMMRSIILEFPEDRTAHTLDLQYMLGENLLVAPIFNDKGVDDYYVPEGTWTNYLTNEKIEGGSWHHEFHDYMNLSLLARPNSLIVECAKDDKVVYDYSKVITVHVFELAEGQTVTSTIVYELRMKVGNVCVSKEGS